MVLLKQMLVKEITFYDFYLHSTMVLLKLEADAGAGAE